MTRLQRFLVAFRLARRRSELLGLALAAEREARDLNGLADAGGQRREPDLLAVMRSTAELLARAPRATAATEAAPPEPDTIEPPPESQTVEPPPEPQTFEPPPVEPPPPPAPPADEPPRAVQELIQVRDMALVAASGEAPAASAALAVLARRLGKVLEYEGVELLEAEGRFDYRFQEIIDVRATTDPDADERVSETVRPGYVLGDRVLRPQQVVVWQLRV
jgi:hypothetical protein